MLLQFFDKVMREQLRVAFQQVTVNKWTKWKWTDFDSGSKDKFINNVPEFQKKSARQTEAFYVWKRFYENDLKL